MGRRSGLPGHRAAGLPVDLWRSSLAESHSWIERSGCRLACSWSVKHHHPASSPCSSPYWQQLCNWPPGSLLRYQPNRSPDRSVGWGWADAAGSPDRWFDESRRTRRLRRRDHCSCGQALKRMDWAFGSGKANRSGSRRTATGWPDSSFRWTQFWMPNHWNRSPVDSPRRCPVGRLGPGDRRPDGSLDDRLDGCLGDRPNGRYCSVDALWTMNSSWSH